MRAADEFRIQAQKRGISIWTIDTCSVCKYPVSFVIRGGIVLFDEGCYCTQKSLGMAKRERDSSWKAIADYYNGIEHGFRKLLADRFWGFKK